MTDPERSPDPTRPERGRWCDQHKRHECTKRRKHGGQHCHGLRIVGLDVCRMHAGQRGTVAKAKGAAVTAWSAVAGKPDVSATDAVLGMLHMSWLRVHLYAGLLQQQVDEAQDDADGVGQGDGVGVGAGLVGQTFSGVKDIGIFATGEAVRGLALLEAQERDRCVRFAKAAHDMGIAEQQIHIAEQQGELLAGVMMRVLDALELPADKQSTAIDVMARELRAIEGGAA